MNNILLVLFSSVISGILGVIISNIYYKKWERRKEKVELIKQLFGNRYDLNGDKFSEALNSIIIVFYDSDNVINKYKTFYDVVSDNATNLNPSKVNSALLDLFKALSKDVNLVNEELNDMSILKVFNVKSPAEKRND